MARWSCIPENLINLYNGRNETFMVHCQCILVNKTAYVFNWLVVCNLVPLVCRISDWFVSRCGQSFGILRLVDDFFRATRSLATPSWSSEAVCITECAEWWKQHWFSCGASSARDASGYQNYDSMSFQSFVRLIRHFIIVDKISKKKMKTIILQN